jgi:hypothetical protein
VNRQPRDHEIGDAPAPLVAGDRKVVQHLVRRPVLQGHVLRRHALAARVVASSAPALFALPSITV